MSTRIEAEVAVLGGGTAGAVVAARLAQAGRDVVVVEAGPDYGAHADGRWPGDLLDAGSLPTSHDWGYRTTGAAGQPLTLDRARVIGGCSTHNGCTQTWGWRGDYDAWAAQTPGWSAAELEPAFERARATLRLRRYAPEEIQPFQAAFLEACAASGERLADDLDDLDGGPGAGCAPVNIVDGQRWNAAFGYLDPVRGSERLRILDRTVAERVELAAGGAPTIHLRSADGGAIVLAAGEAVLCGGAYGTPELLLRSGVGDADALERAGIAVAHDLPGVGRGLQEHQAVHVQLHGSAELAERLDAFARERWLPEEQTILKLASPECDGPYDLHVYPWIERSADAEHGWTCIFPIGLMTPRSRGAVLPGTAGGPARIDHAYLSDARDVRALVHGVERTLELIADPALARLLDRPVALPAGRDAEALAAFVRETHQHYWHPGASCPMGADPARGAVVDGRAQLHGAPGLRIADASIFPRLPRATTAMPTTVVGERVAELMTEEKR